MRKVYDKGFINGRVWIDGRFVKTNVYINKEMIAKISEDKYESKEIYDCQNTLVMPGLIDPHVHFDLDLGYIHSRDNFLCGSRQAAYGGKTTFIDFLDPVDNPEDLVKAYKRRQNEVKQSYVDYIFHATIKNPQCDLEDFVKTMLSLNIKSLKLFTTYSESNRRTYDEDIIKLLKLSEKYKFLLLAHIEADELIHIDDHMTYTDLLKSRPTIAEEKEAMKLASYVSQYGGYLYMVHLSSGISLKKLIEKFPDLINHRFFIESCPHYFIFSNDYLNQDDGYLYTLAPPLRTKEESSLLKKYFSNIFSIGTDHCAFNIKDKVNRPLKDIPLGIGGIENSFDVMYQMFGDSVIDKMSKNIAKIYDKLHNTGKIKEKYLANIFVYDLKQTKIDQHHGCTDYNLYMGEKKMGSTKHLFLRGQAVILSGELQEARGREVNYESID